MPYGVQVRKVTRSQPGSILSLVKLSGVTTLMETTLHVRVRPVESIWKRSPPFGLHAESVEFVEHEPVGQSGVSGYDRMRVLASRATFLTASSCLSGEGLSHMGLDDHEDEGHGARHGREEQADEAGDGEASMVESSRFCATQPIGLALCHTRSRSFRPCRYCRCRRQPKQRRWRTLVSKYPYCRRYGKDVLTICMFRMRLERPEMAGPLPRMRPVGHHRGIS